MRGPRITINAPVFTAAVRIDARLEPDVRAVVGRDDGLRCILKELCLWRGLFVCGAVLVNLIYDVLEPVGRVFRCAPTPNRFVGR